MRLRGDGLVAPAGTDDGRLTIGPRDRKTHILHLRVGPSGALYADLADGRCFRRDPVGQGEAWHPVSVGTCG